MKSTEDTLHRLLRDGTEATAEEADRLVDALGPHLDEAGHGAPARRPVLRGTAIAAVALAAGALVVVWPGAPPEAVPLAASWSPDGDSAVVHPVEGVTLTIDGHGRLAGTSRHPAVEWSRGRIGVSVEPGSLDGLTVETREARVDITGTVFEVSRDALGTRVSVSRGSVTVTCGEAPVRAVQSGDAEAWCLPTTAGGLLGRAQALYDAEAPADSVLHSLDAARALEPANTLLVEILGTRVQTLQRAGDLDSAWETVGEALPLASGFRRDEFRRLALSLATERGDCAAVASHLDAVPPEDERMRLAVEACPELPR